jgi:CelD/BcsL family acetyltransferase involved in cellulose biosynthesis
MDITPVSARELTSEQLQVWADLQQAEAAVDNPCFRPEFTQAVAEVRDDVEVAVMRKEGDFVGFLPFHRDCHNVGRPVGEILSDMHGVVARKGLDWNVEDILKSCGLVALHFDHLIASQQPFASHQYFVDDSPYMALHKGFDGYLSERREAGSSSVTQAQRKLRKLARDVGPVRLELHTGDGVAFDRLVKWKRAQLRERNYFDMFQLDWVIPLLRRIADTSDNEDFRGLLSALYAGDELIAVHLGMQSGAVVSSWIPTFDAAFAKYSPGLLLHLELARSLAELGVKRIDLCRGANQLKTSLASGSLPVAVGCVDRRPLKRLLRSGWFRTRSLVYASPLREPSLQLYRRARNWMTFHTQLKAGDTT